jgi:hypothetical protein
MPILYNLRVFGQRGPFWVFIKATLFRVSYGLPVIMIPFVQCRWLAGNKNNNIL